MNEEKNNNYWHIAQSNRKRKRKRERKRKTTI